MLCTPPNVARTLDKRNKPQTTINKLRTRSLTSQRIIIDWRILLSFRWTLRIYLKRMSSLVESVKGDLYGCRKSRPFILSERHPRGMMTRNGEDRPKWRITFSVGGSRGSNATHTSKKSGSESTEPLKSTSKPDVVFQPAILESEPEDHHHRSTSATAISHKQGKRRWNQATSSSANVFRLRTTREHQDAEKIYILHGALHEARENKVRNKN